MFEVQGVRKIEGSTIQDFNVYLFKKMVVVTSTFAEAKLMKCDVSSTQIYVNQSINQSLDKSVSWSARQTIKLIIIIILIEFSVVIKPVLKRAFQVQWFFATV